MFFCTSRLLTCFFFLLILRFPCVVFWPMTRAELEGYGPRTRAGGRHLEGGKGGDVRILLYRCERPDPSSEKTPPARRETPPSQRKQLPQPKKNDGKNSSNNRETQYNERNPSPAGMSSRMKKNCIDRNPSNERMTPRMKKNMNERNTSFEKDTSPEKIVIDQNT